MIIYDESDITIGSKVILKPEARGIYAHYIDYDVIDKMFTDRIPLTILASSGNDFFRVNRVGCYVNRKHFKPIIFDMVVYKFRDVFILSREKINIIIFLQEMFQFNHYQQNRSKLIRQIDKTGRWNGSLEWGNDIKELPIENLVIKSRNPNTRIIKNWLNPKYELRIY